MKNKELIALFKLEKKGHYKEALELGREYKKLSSEKLPITAINLSFIENRLMAKKVFDQSIVTDLTLETSNSQSTATPTWSAIITMWKRGDYLAEQLSAIRSQSIPPQEIIIIINENHLSESMVRNIGGPDIKIIKSDLNNLYSRWTIAYIAKGEYVSVFDDDVIPGDLWIANAIRACSRYCALVGPSGRVYSPKGIHDYFKFVGPVVRSSDEQKIDCSETDIYCDWVCNSYLFKREWVGYALRAPRYQDSFKTFDDIQLATSLKVFGGIQCVTPMQPKHNTRLHGSLKHDYGNDNYAIWKTNSEHHFSYRKAYIESLINDGYKPVQNRENLFRIHLIVPFGERQYLERCLLSIKGQDYRNYTCTLIDDCHDGADSISLLKQLELDENTVQYIKTTKRLYPLKGRELATDLLNANPADIVVHLDGDDWLPYPDTLSRLNRVYRTGQVMVTYGNVCSVRDHYVRNFTEFSTHNSSKKWNVMQNELSAPVFPFRALKQEDVKGDWCNAPWCAMHMRTFQFVKWLDLNRATFTDKNGEYLRMATDAAIFLPILNSTDFNSVWFVPELMYVYQNAENTIHAKKEITDERKRASLKAIRDAKHEPDLDAIDEVLLDVNSSFKLKDATITYGQKAIKNSRDIQISANRNSPEEATAILTVVTPNYIADAIICLKSYIHNLRTECTAYVFLATEEKEDISACTAILNKMNIKLLSPESLKFTSGYSKELLKKYTIQSNEYRWTMKSVTLIELLQRGFKMALFLDPDTYTVSDITDIHLTMLRHSVSVFPHFRDPDHEYLRKILYKDGFFNGGMLAANTEGKCHLTNLYKRCLHEMVKDPARSRWDDQKYFDLFIIETPNLHVNLDRGIDYNPWNYEPVEGLVSPSQRSYLLKSGFFVRHWHVSTMMINNAIELKEIKYAVYRPVIAIYLLSLLYTITIIIARIKRDKPDDTESLFGLTDRFNSIATKLRQLSDGIPVDELAKLLSLAQTINNDNCDPFVKIWSDSLSKSILFDNFGLFADILSSLYAGGEVEHSVDTLRKQDLRFITDKILSSNETDPKAVQSFLSNLNAGQLIEQRLKTLQSYRIDY